MSQLSEMSRMYNTNPQDFEKIHAALRDAVLDAATFETDRERIIELVAEYADPVAFQILFDAGVSPGYMARFDFSLLTLVAKRHKSNKTPQNGVTDCVNLLLDNRVSVMRKDTNEGLCCYHYAARDADLEFVTALHARGANMKLTGKNGVTPLHELAKYFHASGADKHDQNPGLAERFIKTARVLIEAGVDVDAKNDYGRTAGDVVIEYKSVDLFRLLVSNPTVFQALHIHAYDDIRELAAMDVNALSDDTGDYYQRGMTILAVATSLFDDRAVNLVFEAGAAVNFRDNDGNMGLTGFFRGRPPHDVFKTRGIENILDAYASHGWDVNTPIDADGNTLLARTVKSDFSGGGYNNFSTESSILSWIWPKNPDVNIANTRGQTALMFAVESSDDDMENVLISLLEGGGDITARDATGKTVLHYLATQRSQALARNMADIMFSFGKIDVNAADNDGKTALDIATDNGSEELVKYLLTKI